MPDIGIGAVLLAAGRGTRFGAEPKLLARLDGTPLVRHAAEAALASRARPVVVVLGAHAVAVRAVLHHLDLVFVENAAFGSGLSTSLRAGLAALPAETDAAVAAVKAMPAAERDAAIRGMVAGLDRRLAAKGGSADDWLRLVRSYSVLGERPQAVQALDRARMALSPDPVAMERLDELARELGLDAKAAGR